MDEIPELFSRSCHVPMLPDPSTPENCNADSSRITTIDVNETKFANLQAELDFIFFTKLIMYPCILPDHLLHVCCSKHTLLELAPILPCEEAQHHLKLYLKDIHTID